MKSGYKRDLCTKENAGLFQSRSLSILHFIIETRCLVASSRKGRGQKVTERMTEEKRAERIGDQKKSNKNKINKIN